MVGVYLGLRVFLRHGQSELLDQDSRDLRRESAECLLHMLQVAVDVEMVGVHRRDHGNGGMELEERTVELVRLGHHGGYGTDEEVRPVILGYASQESRAAVAALCQDMGYQRAGGGLAVRAGDGQALLAAGDLTETQRALHHPVTVLPDIGQFRVLRRDGRGIDDERLGDILRNEVGIVLEMHPDALLLKRFGQGGRRAVVSRHFKPLALEVAGDGAHPYSADTYEIDVFHLFSSL